MRGDAPGVAEVGGQREHFQIIEEFTAGFKAAPEVEADDTTAVAHLPAGDLVLRMAREHRVFQRRDRGMALERLGEKQGIGRVPLHADVEGLEAPAEDPRIEGGKGRSRGAAKEIDLFDKVLSADSGAADDASLAVEPFGGGMDDEIGAMLDRRLTDRCGETVVDVEDKVVFPGKRR